MRQISTFLALIAVLALPAGAQARTEKISSFDGTKIKLNFFPAEGLKAGSKAPTVLFGPGWSQAGATDENQQSDPLIGYIGVGVLRKAGYNVLTWDPRGFGDSEGTVTADGPNERRDVQVLFDYVARQKEAKLDAVGDPRVGMTGASYGGGIQLAVAAIDRRLDVIVPDIAWNSFGTSLLKDDTFKAGWSSLLYAAGQQGTLDPHIHSAFRSGATTGQVPKEDKDWFISRGPGDKLVDKIRIPTLLTQGIVDTLFTLTEAARNFNIVRGNGVPVKMLWFCGGHGGCLTDQGDPTRIERAALAWLARWLKRDRSVATGPRFDWIDQDGKRFFAADFPVKKVAEIRATGDGTLPLVNSGGSGPSEPGPGLIGQISANTNGTRATNAVNVVFPTPRQAVPVVGAPRVKLTYTGTGGAGETRVYGQVVDDLSNRVLGNVVTPIPIVLDGKEHVVTRPLEVVSATAKPGQTFTLQIVANASNYDPQRTGGSVTFSKIEATLPVVDPGRTVDRDLGTLRVTRLGVKNRTATVKVRRTGAALRSVVINVRRGRKIVGARRLSSIAGTKTVRVKLKRRASKGLYRVTVSGRRPEGKRIAATRRVRRR